MTILKTQEYIDEEGNTQTGELPIECHHCMEEIEYFPFTEVGDFNFCSKCREQSIAAVLEGLGDVEFVITEAMVDPETAAAKLAAVEKGEREEAAREAWRRRFKATVSALELSSRETASILHASVPTVENWLEGRSAPTDKMREVVFKTLDRIEEGRYQEVLERLKGSTTRRLLGLREYGYLPEWQNDRDNPDNRKARRIHRAAIELLKDRPHVPNKEEARKLRQEAAKKYRGQGKGKSR